MNPAGITLWKNWYEMSKSGKWIQTSISLINELGANEDDADKGNFPQNWMVGTSKFSGTPKSKTVKRILILKTTLILKKNIKRKSWQKLMKYEKYKKWNDDVDVIVQLKNIIALWTKPKEEWKRSEPKISLFASAIVPYM